MPAAARTSRPPTCGGRTSFPPVSRGWVTVVAPPRSATPPLGLREIRRPRDLRGRGPDHDRDLLAVVEVDRARILPIGLAVDVERDPFGTAVLPNTGLVET